MYQSTDHDNDANILFLWCYIPYTVLVLTFWSFGVIFYTQFENSNHVVTVQ